MNTVGQERVMANFVNVGSAEEIYPGDLKLVEIEGRRIVIANDEGEYFALDEACSHEGGPLSEGYVTGGLVCCPWHAGEFDLKTGRCVNPPPTEDIRSYPIKIEDGNVWIALD